MIRSLLRSDDHFYIKLLTSHSIRVQEMYGDEDFAVNPEMHMTSKSRWFDYVVGVTERDVQRLEMISKRIIDETKLYFRTAETSEGKQFNQRDAEFLIKDILERIDVVSDERFSVTDEYKVDLIHHIEKHAVAGFTALHDKYCNRGSPEAVLARKKQSYKDLFVIRLGLGNAASKFCENILKDIILENIEEQLSCTDLLQDLRENLGDLFRDIKSLQASIMIDLLREDKYEMFFDYILNYKGCMKEKIRQESTKYFSKENRLKYMALSKLDGVITVILEALENTVNSSCRNQNFIQTFLHTVGSKLSHSEAGGYSELEIPNRDQFKNIIQQKLEKQVRETIIDTIMSWDVGRKLERKGLGNFLFREIVGCKATCPLCTIPCDAHSGGKTRGIHSSTVHRPQGLGGFFYHKDERLLINDCCFDVASPTAEFLPRDPKLERKWTLYRNYRLMFPDWKILGNADPDMEKYWKWVLMRHNSSFAKYYGVKEAEIPREWTKYRKEGHHQRYRVPLQNKSRQI